MADLFFPPYFLMGPSTSAGRQAPRHRPNASNRGHSCTVCRKKKMKCDADPERLRPCKQCSRLNRADECSYDTTPTLTETLQDRIQDLEATVRKYKASIAIQEQQRSHYAQPAPPSSMGYPNTSTLSPYTHQSSLRHDSSSSEYSSSSGPQGIHGASSFAGTTSSSSTNSELNAQLQNVLLAPNPSSSAMSTSWTLTNSPTPMDPPPLPHVSGPPSVGLGLEVVASAIESDQEWKTEELPPGLPFTQQDLLTIFLAHRHQAHFEISIDRFLDSLSPNSHSRPHPCLLNAMYLFASHFSRSAVLAPYDPLFLSRTKAGIMASVKSQDRILDAIRASCIVALYLYFKGRVVEGYALGGQTSRLAVACGLHQIKPFTPPSSTTAPIPQTPLAMSNMSAGTFMMDNAAPIAKQTPVGLSLPEPANMIEWGERIHLFWQVWCVDKYGIMSTGFAASLDDDAHGPGVGPMMKITTCWPPKMSDFEQGTVDESDLKSLNSIYDLSAPRPRPRFRVPVPTRGGSPSSNFEEDALFGETSDVVVRESVTTMTLKAIELLVSSLKLKAADITQINFKARFSLIDDALDRFARTLPTLLYSEDGSTSILLSTSSATPRMPVHTRMVLPHCIVLSARIVLHGIIAPTDERSYQRCLNAAVDAMRILRAVEDFDFNYFEVALAVCCKHVSEVFLRHVLRLRSHPAPDLTAIQTYQNEADASTVAMKRICHLYAAGVMEQRRTRA